MKIRWIMVIVCMLSNMPGTRSVVSAQQVDQPVFDHLTVEDGLSYPEISAIVQDELGFMWIATFEGLNRYDGYNFVVYKNDITDPTSLSRNHIQCLVQDNRNPDIFWVGTSNGLNKFDRRTGQFTHYFYDPEHRNSLSSNDIMGLAQDSSGLLWIATWDEGINRLDPETGQITRYPLPAETPDTVRAIRGFARDPNGTLWIGSDGFGLTKFEPRTGAYTHYPYDAESPNSLHSAYVRTIFRDPEGMVWIGTVPDDGRGGGAHRFDPATETFTHYEYDPEAPEQSCLPRVWSILLDHEGFFWMGAEEGLSRFDLASETFTHYAHNPDNPYSLAPGWVTEVYQDRAGTIWAAANDAGMSTFTPRMQQFSLYVGNLTTPEKSFEQDEIKSIYEDQAGVLWLGLDKTTQSEGGLTRFDPHSGEVTRYRHDPNDPNSLMGVDAWSVVQDASGTFWVSDNAGINKFDPTTGHFTHYTPDPEHPELNFVRIIYPASNGILWAGSLEGGLYRFDPATEEFTSYRHDPENSASISGDTIDDIAEDKAGNLWIGTKNKGLNRLDPRTGTFTRYTADVNDPSSLSQNTVRVIHVDGDGILWLGTGGGGVNRFDPRTETFTIYLDKDGLPGLGVYGIEEDDQGYLWIATSDNLAQFDPRAETFNVFDIRHNLLPGEFLTGARGRDGQLFFGGEGGFNAFYPEQIEPNSDKPPVVMTDFRLFNRPVTPQSPDSLLDAPIFQTDSMTLSYTDKDFSFEFAALSYFAPEHNRYQYIMEGYHDEWIPTNSGRRTASFTNLPAGSYVFRVKGTNNDGIWSDQEVALKITITPPWWHTALFRAIVFELVVGLIAGSFFVQRKRAQYRERRLEQLVDDRTKELAIATDQAESANEAKSTFMARMSHDLRTPLNGILGYAQILKRDPVTPAHQQNGLAVIEHSGNHLLTLINDVLDLAQVESGAIELYTTDFHLSAFLRAAADLMRIRAERKGIHLHLDMPDTLPAYVHGDERRLRQVLLNLLGNAIKFTDKGSVTLRILDLGFEILDCKALESASSHQKSHIKNLKFEISDTGVGMVPEELERIFDPFQQVGAHERRGAGTGLGLAISRNLVELMGGRLQVSSAASKGSRFWFEIALPEARVDASGTTPSTQRILGIQRCAQCRGDAPKVLVVDDNWENRAVVIDLLRPLGFELIEADNGRQGLEQSATWQPDLVMTDLVMPELDGFELIRHLRQTPASAQIKILAASASVYEDDHRKSLDVGADAFLPKPLDSERLFEELERLLGIEWHYAKDEAPPETGTFALPPVEDVQKILTLTKMRDIDAIQQALHDLHETDAAFQPFARQASRLVETFQLNKLKALLEEYLQQ